MVQLSSFTPSDKRAAENLQKFEISNFVRAHSTKKSARYLGQYLIINRGMRFWPRFSIKSKLQLASTAQLQARDKQLSDHQ